MVEVMIALVLLSVGILAVTQLQVSFMQSNARSNVVTTGSAQAQMIIEQLLALPNDAADLEDDDADGTGQDLVAPWGEDDNGGNFGLDDVAAAADGSASTTRNNITYNYFWNVAVDHPQPGAKTVKVIVNWTENGVPRSVDYSFIKAR